MVLPGRVLIAPGDYHMKLKKRDGNYFVECAKGQRVNGHCPSVDVLFNSVAEVAGRNAIGIILTGMGSDGAKGLLAMRNKGARTLGQDEKSSVVYGMPKVAFDIGAVEKQASLEAIPQLVFSLLKND
jgi:two-component system chemotaxis response regulator CheB